MSVVKLVTQNFRNLQDETIFFHPVLNFFVGDNGSGKSSLLEAIFFLGHGKSFRTSKVEHLANYNKDDFVVSIKDDNNLQLGLSKSLITGATNIKVNGERHIRLSILAQNIAVQIVTPESFKLFFGGPKERRRFIDLGLFHVKHEFAKQWREFSRVLKQRNACIRNTGDATSLHYWTDIFCHQSEAVALIRKGYIDSLVTELIIWLNILLPDIADKISVQYQQGWPQKKTLSEALSANIEREQSFGYSLYGAHKFDVKFMLAKQVLESQLSRGQQKLFLLALTFAQAKLIARVKRVKPILLIDDVGAELDVCSRNALSIAIDKLDCQIIMTAIDEVVLQPFISDNTMIDVVAETRLTTTESVKDKYSMFHVKHGNITPVNNSVTNE